MMTTNVPVPVPGRYLSMVNVHYVDAGDTSVCLFPYTYTTDTPHTSDEALNGALDDVAALFAAIGDGTRVIGADITTTWENQP